MKSKHLIYGSLMVLLSLCVLVPGPARAAEFTYLNSQTGLGVIKVGQYTYNTVGRQTAFDTSQAVFVLTKLANISGVNTFQVRQEIWTNGTKLAKTFYSPLFMPLGSYWAENQTWNNLGTFSSGNHQIRIAISLNGGDYIEQQTIGITVTGVDNNFTFITTDAGTGVQLVGPYEYAIVDKDTAFKTTDSVHILTKLADIRNIDTFRLKHEVFLSGQSLFRSFQSSIYRPDGSLWAVNTPWNIIGQLPAGNHTVKTSISVNGGEYQLLDTLAISITGTDVNYQFVSTDAGTGIADIGNYRYEIVGGKSDFSAIEDIFVLTKLANIQNAVTFQVKHEVLLNGGTPFRMFVSPVFKPDYSFWSYNHTWNEIGKLPAGNYELRTSISVNGGEFVEAGVKNITVTGQAQPGYDFITTETGLGVKDIGGYKLDIVSPKTDFTPTELIYALTKLSNIRDISTFRIRHEVTGENIASTRSLYSPLFRPDGGFWSVNNTWNQIGKLPVGNYSLKTAISIDGGSYEVIDERSISVN